MRWPLSLVALLLAFTHCILADCVSYGVDFVDGGGPYCINTTSSDYFSFTSDFFGCSASDSQGDITPILIDPNGDEYFCSDIPITPDGVNYVSTCNVPGNELEKNQMFSGDWIVVIEGLTFAYMRTFSILAGPPVTVTQTPTAIFTVTSIPSTTVTTTLTTTYPTTLAPVTKTVPSTTSTKTLTTTPSKVTITSTKLFTVTRTSRVFSKTITTTTITTPCATQPRRRDPICTIHPAKAQFAASTDSTAASRRIKRFRQADRPWSGGRRSLPAAVLVERAPDLCTTTVLDTIDAVTSYTTIIGPTSTEIDTTDTTLTTTITPPPVTAYSGVANAVVTVTAPTPTRTIVRFGLTSTRTTKTIWATITSTVKTTPSGVVCASIAKQ